MAPVGRLVRELFSNSCDGLHLSEIESTEKNPFPSKFKKLRKVYLHLIKNCNKVPFGTLRVWNPKKRLTKTIETKKKI